MDDPVLLKADVKRLTAEVERLEKRVRDLEVRWERDILGGVNAEMAEMKGTVAALRHLHADLHSLLLKALLP